MLGDLARQDLCFMDRVIILLMYKSLYRFNVSTIEINSSLVLHNPGFAIPLAKLSTYE